MIYVTISHISSLVQLCVPAIVGETDGGDRYFSSDRARLEELGSTSSDLKYADTCPERYMSAFSELSYAEKCSELQLKIYCNFYLNPNKHVLAYTFNLFTAMFTPFPEIKFIINNIYFASFL